MADIFVSYVRRDRPVAAELSRELESAGFSVWWDRLIGAGTQFSSEIEREIEAARAVVVLWSTASRDSQWVRDEAAYARDRNKLIPLLLDGSEPPLGFRQIQALDLSESTGDRASVFADVVSAARRLMDGASGAHALSASRAHGADLDSNVATKKRRATARVGVLAGVGVVAIAVATGYSLSALNHQRSAGAVASSEPSTSAAKPLPIAGMSIAEEPIAGMPIAGMPIAGKSIAVLPFTDMSEGQDREYLADGMAEEIINLLANVPDLYVPARTSSFYFKNKQSKIPDIARELGVAQVLEGSIKVSGNRLRVTAQLVRADTGYHVWTERYDRELRDIFQVQDEIANAVAQATQIHLMGGTLARRKGGTENLEAYQLYLRAVSARQRHTKASLDESDSYLQPALALDPKYGMAWMLMANNAVIRSDSGFVAPSVGYEQGRQIAQRVLEFSPDYAPAYATLLYVYRTLDWDWAAAETAGRRALALDPNDSWALWMGAALATTLGRWDEAEQKIDTILVRDPFDTFGIWTLALSQYNAARYTDFDATIQRLLKLAPDFLWARAYLGKTYLAQGRPQAALEMVQQEADEWVRLWFLPIVLRAVGRDTEADDALNTLIARTTPGSGPYFVAMNYAYRGDADLAFEWLERAYRERDFALVEIVGEVLFANIANDPRFNAFLIRMKLPTDWTTRIAVPTSQERQ